MKTTHDQQTARYTESFKEPATVAEATNKNEIALLLKEIVQQQKRIAESQEDLERLTERNLTAIRAALAGTK